MHAVSSAISGAAPLPPAAGAKPPLKSQPQEGRPLRPTRDQYVPEEKPEASGRYWLDRDEDGSPRLRFDGPAPTDAPEATDGPEKPKRPDKRSDECTCNTDQVDRELEALRKKQETLARQLRSETDGTKASSLQRELAQVERELAQKDNNAYRRQHAVFS